MRVALDTNILAYIEGADDTARQAIATDIVDRLPEELRVVPVQALGELYNVLVRKVGWPRERARATVVAWRSAVTALPTTGAAMMAALDLATDHRLPIWDSVMLAVAAENDCQLLLSEDFQDGFTWRGVTVANPFAPVLQPPLDAILSGR